MSFFLGMSTFAAGQITSNSLTVLFPGGFIQFTARLARQYLRPFFLVPNPAGASHAPIVPNPTTTAKYLYDAAGIFVSIAMLNYVVAPFQLLDLKRSIRAWHRMDWYGHVIIGGALIFFLNGGKKICREALVKRGINVDSKKPALGTSNGKSTPGAVTPGTPGSLGTPNGFPLTVLPVEQGVKGAQMTLNAVKKTQ